MSVLNPNHAPTPAEREILNTELTETLGKIGVSVCLLITSTHSSTAY